MVPTPAATTLCPDRRQSSRGSPDRGVAIDVELHQFDGAVRGKLPDRREHGDVVVVSYVLSYGWCVTVLNFRTDERSEKALAELMSDGSSASEAIRQALVDAVRLRRREQMRAESRALMNDEADRAESRRVLAEMDELRAW